MVLTDSKRGATSTGPHGREKEQGENVAQSLPCGERQAGLSRFRFGWFEYSLWALGYRVV